MLKMSLRLLTELRTKLRLRTSWATLLRLGTHRTSLMRLIRKLLFWFNWTKLQSMLMLRLWTCKVCLPQSMLKNLRKMSLSGKRPLRLLIQSSRSGLRYRRIGRDLNLSFWPLRILELNCLMRLRDSRRLIKNGKNLCVKLLRIQVLSLPVLLVVERSSSRTLSSRLSCANVPLMSILIRRERSSPVSTMFQSKLFLIFSLTVTTLRRSMNI
mmetsp:Transcript_16431/g.11575  ORF Transcript_16431/g.11575 Transcript_16431/m.11575 type:complete len:212 (-) Transcript_16431:8884-9519(-)